MTSDPYAVFIGDVANDQAIFQGRRCRISRKALNEIGMILESQPYAVASAYILDRAKRARDNDEAKALRQLQAHLRHAANNGLNPSKISFLVRKLHVFPEILEAL